MKRRIGFTLAEVLITLAIIGVVAAMTIPTLISANQQRGWNTAATVFERKLEESLKVMNSQGTLAGYRNTKDFVTELSKHLKIIKICDNNDLMSCFEDSITWNILNISSGSESEIIDVTNIKTASDLGKDDWNTDVVGVQLANGTSAILAYNPDCKQDPYSNQITGTSCLAMVYDTSGFSKPNTFPKDVRSVNSVLGSCAFKSDTTCYGTPFYPTPHVWKGCDSNGNTTNAEDLEFMAKYNIEYCMTSDYGTNDYWAGAVAACGGVNKMPTMAQVAEIANYIYNTDQVGAKTNVSNLTRDDDKVSSLGLAVTSVFYIWSGNERNLSWADHREFFHNYTKVATINRNYSHIQAVCLGE